MGRKNIHKNCNSEALDFVDFYGILMVEFCHLVTELGFLGKDNYMNKVGEYKKKIYFYIHSSTQQILHTREKHITAHTVKSI